MSATNTSVVIGYMSKPEFTTVGEHLKASFGLVQNYKVKGEDKAEWIDVEAWGKTAELLQSYRADGGQVAVQGEIRVDSWEKEGEKRRKTYLKAHQVSLQGTKADNAKSGGSAPASSAPPASSGGSDADDFSLDDDELPPF